jgi:hypothetical protein
MRKRFVVTVILVALLVVGAWRLRRLERLARVGVGYAAEQTCACLFVSGRTLESCRRDLDPEAQRLVALEAGAAEVTAHVSILASATARYEPGFGCSLVH